LISVLKIVTNVSINLFFRNSNFAKVRDFADENAFTLALSEICRMNQFAGWLGNKAGSQSNQAGKQSNDAGKINNKAGSVSN